MTCSITVHGTTATVDHGVWTSTRASLTNLLNALTPPQGVPASVPNKDAWLAVHAAEELHGVVVLVEKLPPGPPGTVY